MKIGNFMTNKYEAYCPLCKTIANNFLSLNEKRSEVSGEHEQVLEQMKQQFPELYQSFTDKIKGLVASLKKKLVPVPAQPIEEEEEEKKVDEDIVEILFVRAYEYFVEGFYLQKQPKNLNKQFVLYKNFFKGFQDYYIEKERSDEVMPSFLESAAMKESRSLVKEISKIDDINKLLGYQPEDLVNRIFIETLQEILSSRNLVNEESLRKNQLDVLKEYIVFKVIQGIALLKIDHSFSFEDCVKFYLENAEFRAKIANELIFPMQKIILAYWLNYSIGSDVLPKNTDFFQVLLQNPSNTDAEGYLSELLSQIGILIPFDQFVQEAFSSVLSARSQEDLTALKSLLAAKAVGLEFENPRIVKYGPRRISLPENYAQFNNDYFVEKCQLCHKFSHHLLTSICLICGEIMCEMYCDPTNKVSGNLNRHAKKYHLGMGLFIDMVKLGGRLINVPLNLRYREQEPYIDNLGQSFNSMLDSHHKLKDFDFGKFMLNQKYVEEIDQMIRLQSVRQTIFKIGLRLNTKSGDGYL